MAQIFCSFCSNKSRLSSLPCIVCWTLSTSIVWWVFAECSKDRLWKDSVAWICSISQILAHCVLLPISSILSSLPPVCHLRYRGNLLKACGEVCNLVQARPAISNIISAALRYVMCKFSNVLQAKGKCLSIKIRCYELLMLTITIKQLSTQRQREEIPFPYWTLSCEVHKQMLYFFHIKRILECH